MREASRVANMVTMVTVVLHIRLAINIVTVSTVAVLRLTIASTGVEASHCYVKL